MVAPIDRRLDPAAEPDGARSGLRRLHRPPPSGGVDQRREVNPRPFADHRTVQVHEVRPDRLQIDPEAFEIGGVRTPPAAPPATASRRSGRTRKRWVWPTNCMSAENSARTSRTGVRSALIRRRPSASCAARISHGPRPCPHCRADGSRVRTKSCRRSATTQPSALVMPGPRRDQHLAGSKVRAPARRHGVARRRRRRTGQSRAGRRRRKSRPSGSRRPCGYWPSVSTASAAFSADRPKRRADLVGEGRAHGLRPVPEAVGREASQQQVRVRNRRPLVPPRP